MENIKKALEFSFTEKPVKQFMVSCNNVDPQSFDHTPTRGKGINALADAYVGLIDGHVTIVGQFDTVRGRRIKIGNSNYAISCDCMPLTSYDKTLMIKNQFRGLLMSCPVGSPLVPKAENVQIFNDETKFVTIDYFMDPVPGLQRKTFPGYLIATKNPDTPRDFIVTGIVIPIPIDEWNRWMVAMDNFMEQITGPTMTQIMASVLQYKGVDNELPK